MKRVIMYFLLIMVFTSMVFSSQSVSALCLCGADYLQDICTGIVYGTYICMTCEYNQKTGWDYFQYTGKEWMAGHMYDYTETFHLCEMDHLYPLCPSYTGDNYVKMCPH
ncbi:MAG TPA: hypothetical protein DDZ89_02840 [Clostridiales bacterium]|nr:hypothetical protein [Clostridiales bacterium]